MGRIILVTGGARSGKSTFAEKTVATFGQDVCYIATALAFDEGMQERIDKHRADRPSDWYTLEAYEAIPDQLKTLHKDFDAYMLDCVTLMVTNLMFKDAPDYDTLAYDQIDEIEKRIHHEMRTLLAYFRSIDANLVLVTNEVGSGIVPENKMARIYRDLAGRVNQVLGHLVDEVYLVVCGQALCIKGEQA